MSDTNAAHGWARVSDDTIWGYTKIIFLGSLLIFLVNVALGFGNVITPGEIPRWQFLTHLHGGTIGWLTLTAIGFTIWLFTGNRPVSPTYEKRIRWLAWAAVLLGLGYVLSFGVSFSLTGNAFTLLPIFGTGMMLVFWATALLALTQLRQQPVLRNEHLILAAAFTLASVGAIMGVLLGFQHALGTLPLPEGLPNLQGHAFPMDLYALVTGSAVIEWLFVGDEASEWTWPGLVQAVVWAGAGLLVFIAAVSGFMPLALVGLILGLVLGPLIFLGRIGWRVVITDPRRGGAGRWAVFTPIWLVVFIVLFLGSILGPIPQDLEWVGPVSFHAYFVGYLTNALFGVLSNRTSASRTLHEWAEPGAFWLVNLGLVAFAATEIAYGGRHGAVVMGIGVLLGVVTIGYRLLGDTNAPGSAAGIEGENAG